MGGSRQRWKDEFTLFLLRHSSLFDADYYRARAGLPAGADAARHYYEGGWRSADPSPRFRQNLYLAANTDVRAAEVCPLGHYLLYGRRAGRRLSPEKRPPLEYHPRRFIRGMSRAFCEFLYAPFIRENRGARILTVVHLAEEEALPEVNEYLKNLRPYDAELVFILPEGREDAGIREEIRRVWPKAEILPREGEGEIIFPHDTMRQRNPRGSQDSGRAATCGGEIGTLPQRPGTRDPAGYDAVIRVRAGRASDENMFREEKPSPDRTGFLVQMESVLGARRIHRNLHQLRRGNADLIAAKSLLVQDSRSRERLVLYRLRQAGLSLAPGYTFAAGGSFCVRGATPGELARAAGPLPDLERAAPGKFTMDQALERWLSGSVPESRQLGVRVCGLRLLRGARGERRRARREARVLARRIQAAEANGKAGEMAPAGAETLQKLTKKPGTAAADHRGSGGSLPASVGARQRPTKFHPLCSGDGGLTIAFAVSEAGEGAVAGDYFTALELAEALERRGCRTRFLAQMDASHPWQAVGEEVDVLVSMLQFYPLDRMVQARRDLIRVGWARNWFDGWLDSPVVDEYDLLLASSETARREMTEVLGRRVELFPIATNPARFSTDMEDKNGDGAKYDCDYCFTGNHFGLKREIEEELRPEELPWRLKIFGEGWQDRPLGPWACGHVSYAEMPKIYRHARVVLDDATPSTRETGAVNSRVYDALAAGCLVITNNERGAEETFQGLLPVYRDWPTLKEQLNLYLGDEALRRAKVKELRNFVLTRHTYDLRAERLLDLISARGKAGEEQNCV